MNATHTGSTSTRFGASWRELAHTPTHQVPVLLGGVLAILAGVLTYAFDVAKATAIVPMATDTAFLLVFGIIGLIGYGVAKSNVQNGSLVAAIAGIALAAIVGGTMGLFAGLLLLAGAVWSLAATR